MKVLVVGGAGYIGAHVVRCLAEKGHAPIILDDFRSSSKDRVGNYPYEAIALEETGAVINVFAKHRPEAVIHLGGYISVGESVRDPAKYWNNNLGASTNLLVACAKYPIQAFVFSSTAAVYGDVKESPIKETVPLQPTSPYGASKLAFEHLLHSAGSALKFRTIALRYFNASGAHVEWRVGEQHDPEEHLIPRVIRFLQAGEPVQVYGNDYPTSDGTCVRDYIHVLDLADAHVRVLEADHLSGQHSFNVGSGQGHSVLQVIQAIGKNLNLSPNILTQERRPGDPPSLVADPSLLRSIIGWRAQYSDIEAIVESAIQWEQTKTQGS